VKPELRCEYDSRNITLLGIRNENNLVYGRRIKKEEEEDMRFNNFQIVAPERVMYSSRVGHKLSKAQ
jgi:hypothetical protein